MRFPLPTSLAEARVALAGVRRGLASMMARFEPARFESIERVLATFGDRETLGGMRLARVGAQSVVVTPPDEVARVVH